MIDEEEEEEEEGGGEEGRGLEADFYFETSQTAVGAVDRL